MMTGTSVANVTSDTLLDMWVEIADHDCWLREWTWEWTWHDVVIMHFINQISIFCEVCVCISNLIWFPMILLHYGRSSEVFRNMLGRVLHLSSNLIWTVSKCRSLMLIEIKYWVLLVVYIGYSWRLLSNKMCFVVKNLILLLRVTPWCYTIYWQESKVILSKVFFALWPFFFWWQLLLVCFVLPHVYLLIFAKAKLLSVGSQNNSMMEMFLWTRMIENEMLLQE